jgi:methylated-DNA-[protein]-cysteine S-methyltransferase
MLEKLDFDSSGSIASPIGAVNVYAKGDAVVFLTMSGAVAPTIGSSSAVDSALSQLGEYFAGKRTVLDFKVRTSGTSFQEAVWAEIAKIPFGQTVSYADIARAIGKPLASRAVGGAVGSNPVPLVIGCHRVMGASGRITGYSGGDGIPTKRWLLAHERIASVD